MSTKMKRLVNVAADANHNKFYELTLDGDTVHVRWGRVGATGQSKDYAGGEAKFDSLLRAKLAKGYDEVEVVDAPSGRGANNVVLRSASASLARPEFAADPRIAKVIDDIVTVNAHSIATASGGRITLKDGQLRTPLGIIGRTSLDRAEQVLDQLTANPNVPDLETYLRLVPQSVGSRRGWADDLLTPESLRMQRDFVSQLRDSLDFAETQLSASTPGVDFRFHLGVVEPDDERFAAVSRAFEHSMNSHHDSRRFKLVGLYDLTDTDTHSAAYVAARDRLGNEQWLWHGTRAANVLSVLAKGLYVPPSGNSFVTGRMFGDGIYGSKQSTKSLNYSIGAAPGQMRGGRQDRAYMFSMQAVMGNSYKPTSRMSSWNSIHKSHDSIDVAPHTCGVLNHEAIIWNLEQVSLRYLCEFAL